MNPPGKDAAEKRFRRREISILLDTCSTYRSEFRRKSISNFRPARSAHTRYTRARARARTGVQKKIHRESGGRIPFPIFRKKLKSGTIGLSDRERPKLDQMCLAALIIQRPAA